MGKNVARATGKLCSSCDRRAFVRSRSWETCITCRRQDRGVDAYSRNIGLEGPIQAIRRCCEKTFFRPGADRKRPDGILTGGMRNRVFIRFQHRAKDSNSRASDENWELSIDQIRHMAAI